MAWDPIPTTPVKPATAQPKDTTVLQPLPTCVEAATRSVAPVDSVECTAVQASAILPTLEEPTKATPPMEAPLPTVTSPEAEGRLVSPVCKKYVCHVIIQVT